VATTHFYIHKFIEVVSVEILRDSCELVEQQIDNETEMETDRDFPFR